mmetsp:Transcript_93853/g.148261  ORF Transcript_93853/g.148261 Transcript_93853/m.148261 type:complete len:525 (+) Transcript_93853:60-1634(+)
MTRHYKLSTGSAGSGAGDRKGRSSICERYSKDWVFVGKGNAAADMEESPAASSPASPLLGVTDGTGGTAEPSLVEDCLQETEGTCDLVEVEGRTLAPPIPHSPKSLPARLAEWTCEDVCTWASSVSMASEVVEILRANAISGNILCTLTEDDLRSMGMHKLGWRRLLICRRDDLAPPPSWVKTDPDDGVSDMPNSARPSNSVLYTARDASPLPGRGGIGRTPSSLRSSAGGCFSALPRTPLIADLPTPLRSGAGTARSVRHASMKTMTLQAGSLQHSFTPLPKKPAFATPVCHSTLPRSSSMRIRTEESPLPMGMVPRSVSCIRPRASSTTTLWQTPTPSVVLSAVPVVAPAGVVAARPPAQPLSLQVTVRPLSPSSGRVRQGPPLRRVRSSDPREMERLASTRPLSPSSGRVRQAPPRHVVRRSNSESLGCYSYEASMYPSDAGSARSSTFIPLPRTDEAAAEVATLESVFGAVASSWERVNREMEMTIAEDFKELQRQFSRRFDHEVDDLGSNSKVKRFETL